MLQVIISGIQWVIKLWFFFHPHLSLHQIGPPWFPSITWDDTFMSLPVLKSRFLKSDFNRTALFSSIVTSLLKSNLHSTCLICFVHHLPPLRCTWYGVSYTRKLCSQIKEKAKPYMKPTPSTQTIKIEHYQSVFFPSPRMTEAKEGQWCLQFLNS